MPSKSTNSNLKIYKTVAVRSHFKYVPIFLATLFYEVLFPVLYICMFGHIYSMSMDESGNKVANLAIIVVS